MRQRIRAALVPDPPQKLSEGGLVREGFDRQLDTLRETAEQGRAWIASLEERERLATGIPTLNLYQGGEVVKSIVGARPKAALLNELSDII